MANGFLFDNESLADGDVPESEPPATTQEPATYPDLPNFDTSTPSKHELAKQNATGIVESRYRARYGPSALDYYDDFYEKRTLSNLEGFEPIRLGFMPPAETENGEVGDNWYETIFNDLYLRVRDFAKFFESSAEYRGDYTGSPWLEEFPRDFIHYAAEVARCDPLRGGWDTMLRSPPDRVYLVTGILSKVLEENVFGELLFGADEIQRQMLEGHDAATIDSEGYIRTQHRSQMIRTILLESGDLTTNFWPAVDRLALETTNFFLPLLNHLAYALEGSGWRPSRTRPFHQKVHDIIAEAAFVSITLRRSSTVFYIDFPPPGSLTDLDQDNVDHTTYEKSKALADVEVKRVKRLLRSQEGLPRSNNNTPGQSDVPGLSPSGPLHASVNSAVQGPEELVIPNYTAKVQFVLWPCIKRYMPIGDRDGEASIGEQITKLTKARCAYYRGLMNENVSSPENETLQDYISARKRERRNTSAVRRDHNLYDIVRTYTEPPSIRFVIGALIVLAASHIIVLIFNLDSVQSSWKRDGAVVHKNGPPLIPLTVIRE